MASRKKGPEKRKFLVKRANPAVSRKAQPNDDTLELNLGGTEPAPNMEVRKALARRRATRCRVSKLFFAAGDGKPGRHSNPGKDGDLLPS